MTSKVSWASVELDQQGTEAEGLDALYEKLADAHMIPLWTQIHELMPQRPAPRAQPYVWHWNELYPLAKRAGALVPVGRGGERRAIALANPGLDGLPFATPTLWAAIQYLGPHEVAPEHRHTQNAFRFVLEGEGVWTVVNGDPVAMRRGDFLLTPGWNFHGHQNVTEAPMAWLDGLDIPFVYQTDTSFFELGPEDLTDTSTPERSRAERLWGHPGLQPISLLGTRASSPLPVYRWQNTDRALTDQLALEAEGHPATLEPGHAAIRFSNPTTGGDVLPTIRADFHRLREGVGTAPRKEVGSSVWQVFTGKGTAAIDGVEHELEHGDVFVVPSWAELELQQAALSTQMDGLSNANWSTEVVTGQGRTITATEIPWIRAREVWIHAVDLNAGGDFADFPAAFVDKLIDEAVAKHRAGDTPTLEVCPTDREDDRSVSVHEANAPVEGAASDLARWLTRREARGLRRSDGTPLPELGPWL